MGVISVIKRNYCEIVWFSYCNLLCFSGQGMLQELGDCSFWLLSHCASKCNVHIYMRKVDKSIFFCSRG